MEIKGIKYVAPLFDNSGYAQASRGNVLALHKLGIPLTLSPISFEEARPNLGENGIILESLINKDIDYNIVIIHSTPEFWTKYRENNKINIGYTVWETDKLHKDWPGYINNNVDKCLVVCEWNKEVFEESGVNVPIGIVPHGIDDKFFSNSKLYNIDGMNEGAYIFYSIFQWQERKDPISLLKAYWYAFQKNENVALVLKSYRSDYSDTEKDAIRSTILRLKYISPIIDGKFPPVYLISDMLSSDEIMGLHATGDCYVSLDRGEGWGLGPFEAGASGNPIIITGIGGALDYAKSDNSYLVNFTLTPVFGMPWCPWYSFDQLWAQADIYDGAMKMREVYENREIAKRKGKLLQSYIKDNFRWENIGNKIIEEIKVM